MYCFIKLNVFWINPHNIQVLSFYLIRSNDNTLFLLVLFCVYCSGRVEAVEAKNHIDEAFSRIIYAPEKNPQNRCDMCRQPVSKSKSRLHKYFCKWRPLIPASGDEPFTYETAGKLSIRLLKKQPKFMFGRILSSRAGDTDLFGDEPLVFVVSIESMLHCPC